MRGRRHATHGGVNAWRAHERCTRAHVGATPCGCPEHGQAQGQRAGTGACPYGFPLTPPPLLSRGMCFCLHALRVCLAAYTPAVRAQANDYSPLRGGHACEGKGTLDRLLGSKRKHARWICGQAVSAGVRAQRAALRAWTGYACPHVAPRHAHCACPHTHRAHDKVLFPFPN